MQAEFDSLDTKVAQIVNLCERLRSENTDLRRQLTSVRGDAERLSAKVDVARSRIEDLVARLPD